MTTRSPKRRAGLTKGRCVRGTYIPSDRAAEITRSLSFTRPSRVLGQFSADDGYPGTADAENGVLRRFAFRLADADGPSDILTQSAPIHDARTLERMLPFEHAGVSRSNGNPDTKINALTSTNREKPRRAQFRAQRGSFARTTFWGVHAFPATNARGDTRFIKFKVEPVGGEITLSSDEARRKSANVRNDDLEVRIAARDVRFSVLAVLDRPGDPIMNVAIRWPDEDKREAVRLGTIVITGLETNEVWNGLAFDPANLAEGIGQPPDEVFAARCAAYAASRTRGR
ncbi:catalase [Bradyrhizobium sp. CCBAU 11357]|uniref:catalase n=1 Tax=Bradyrhizobium sp. CCBAU 11357 TaxID=1630808 RepID=UPI002302B58B|nr:catalase [Bradyrhizobium sp. CCBAU 11357]MDA9499223.1 catalase [Bradyrhizobium sp. CCBAU 11357]